MPPGTTATDPSHPDSHPTLQAVLCILKRTRLPFPTPLCCFYPLPAPPWMSPKSVRGEIHPSFVNPPSPSFACWSLPSPQHLPNPLPFHPPSADERLALHIAVWDDDVERLQALLLKGGRSECSAGAESICEDSLPRSCRHEGRAPPLVAMHQSASRMLPPPPLLSP